MMHKIKEIELAKKRVNGKCLNLIGTLKEESQLKEELEERNREKLYRI